MLKLSKSEINIQPSSILDSQNDFLNYILNNWDSAGFKSLHFSLWAKEHFNEYGTYTRASSYGEAFDEAYDNGFRMQKDTVLSHAEDVFKRFHNINSKTAI